MFLILDVRIVSAYTFSKEAYFLLHNIRPYLAVHPLSPIIYIFHCLVISCSFWQAYWGVIVIPT